MTEKEFKELFYAKYESFCNYACSIIKDEAGAEDIVQEVFIDFWKKHTEGIVALKTERYLVRAIKYKCIDHMRKQTVHRNYVNATAQSSASKPFHETEAGPEVDLQQAIQLAIDQLPPKTKEVFVLSKINKLSYREIALKMSISEKTVENQMARAFRQLRSTLREYEFFWMLIIYFIIE